MNRFVRSPFQFLPIIHIQDLKRETDAKIIGKANGSTITKHLLQSEYCPSSKFNGSSPTRSLWHCTKKLLELWLSRAKMSWLSGLLTRKRGFPSGSTRVDPHCRLTVITVAQRCTPQPCARCTPKQAQIQLSASSVRLILYSYRISSSGRIVEDTECFIIYACNSI
jgi:hypothetical protein